MTAYQVLPEDTEVAQRLGLDGKELERVALFISVMRVEMQEVTRRIQAANSNTLVEMRKLKEELDVAKKQLESLKQIAAFAPALRQALACLGLVEPSGDEDPRVGALASLLNSPILPLVTRDVEGCKAYYEGNPDHQQAFELLLKVLKKD